MPTYEIVITEENNQFLVKLAETAGKTVDDLLHDLVTEKLAGDKIDLIIKEYKEGKMKAVEAWKLSGLPYNEFLALANKQ